VNNFETGDLLLQGAREFLPELQRAFERESWNVVVRRAQEIVELSLKAALKMMGIEYPKEHDVADVFAQACMIRGLGIEEAALNTVREISARLARDRQPAFYMERRYSQDDAVRARQGAQMVLALIGQLVERMRGVLPESDEKRVDNPLEGPPAQGEDPTHPEQPQP
jgi:HEPN domain-containing protein